MVIDMLRLPGVLAAGGLSQAYLSLPEGGRGPCVSPGPEHPHMTPAVSTRKGNCNARYVDLSVARSRCYPDPRSGTDPEAVAGPGRRPAA